MTITLDRPALTRALVAREYTRSSTAKEVSIERQERDNAKMAAANGWTLSGQSYTDMVSASKHGRKVRDGYAQLVSDLESGAFRADILLIWESSRGSRKVSEWARLIELCEEKGVKIAVASDRRVYDPSHPRDVRAMQEDAVDGQYESGKLSMRIKSARELEAESGRPHGGPPFGYQGVYDEEHRKPRAPWWIPEPAEADIVRELFRRFLAGHSLYSIANDFEERGIVSRDRTVKRMVDGEAAKDDDGNIIRDVIPGIPLSIPVLRGMLLSPNYAALRVYEGEEHAGKWVPIVSAADYRRAKAKLDARTTGSLRRAEHLLSGIARCGVCGGPLGPKPRKAAPAYGCKKGHVMIDEAELDALAKFAISEYVTKLSNAMLLSKGDDTSDEVRALDDEIAKLRERKAELVDMLDDPDSPFTTAEITQRANKIKANILEKEKRRSDLSTPSELAALLTPGAWLDFGAHFENLPMSAKREAAKMILSEDTYGALVVLRSPRPRHEHCPSLERVGLRRTGGLITPTEAWRDSPAI